MADVFVVMVICTGFGRLLQWNQFQFLEGESRVCLVCIYYLLGFGGELLFADGEPGGRAGVGMD